MEQTQISLRAIGFLPDKKIMLPGEFGKAHKLVDEYGLQIYCRTMPNYLHPILNICIMIYPSQKLSERQLEYINYYQSNDMFGKATVIQKPVHLDRIQNYSGTQATDLVFCLIAYEHTVDLLHVPTPAELKNILFHARVNAVDIKTALKCEDPFDWGGEFFNVIRGEPDFELTNEL